MHGRIKIRIEEEDFIPIDLLLLEDLIWTAKILNIKL